MPMRELGVFPLGIVLLPGERAPLHIFEERYKEMIGESLQTGDEFAVVFADDEGVRSVVTTAAVAEVLQRFPDGRMDVVVEGRDRIHIERLTGGRSFITAEVVAVPDQFDEPPPSDVDACLHAYADVAEAAGATAEDFDPDDPNLSLTIAGTVALGAELKQELLEVTSERDRLQRLTAILAAAAEGVRRAHEAERRSAGNGLVEGL
jgi:Lon protease-like protein